MIPILWRMVPHPYDGFFVLKLSGEVVLMKGDELTNLLSSLPGLDVR